MNDTTQINWAKRVKGALAKGKTGYLQTSAGDYIIESYSELSGEVACRSVYSGERVKIKYSARAIASLLGILQDR